MSYSIKDKDGDRAIHHAAFGNEPAVIELLASVTSSCFRPVNSEKKTPTSNLVNTTPQSLDLNSRNKKRQTALHIAVNKNHLDVVRTLVSLGAHPSLQDIDGDTPLHDAITKKFDSIIELLLDAHADMSLSNKYGFNAVHHAALRGNPSTMKLILDKVNQQEKGWLVDEKKEDGFGALHLACLNNYVDIVHLILESGSCNINLQNANLQTPLHLAIERLNYDIVKLLLTKKPKCESSSAANEPLPLVCNVNAQDKENDTPLHCLLRNLTVLQLKKLKELNEKDKHVRLDLIRGLT